MQGYVLNLFQSSPGNGNSTTSDPSPHQQDRDPPVPGVARLVADQWLAICHALDLAEAGFADPVRQQRLARGFGAAGRERPVVGAI